MRRTSALNPSEPVVPVEVSHGLAKLETARDLILAAKTVDEAKDLADKAAAAEIWAKRSKLGLEVQNHAAEIKIRAERRAGELLAMLERKPKIGLRKGKDAPPSSSNGQRSEYAQTLEKSGATRQEANRWERVARVPELAFERAIASAKEARKEITTSTVLGSKGDPASMQDRRTPRWLFELLDKRFGPFVLDAFAQPHNALCPRFLTRTEDGCIHPWEDITFANPEFEDMVRPLAHAVAEAERGVRSIIVSPVGCSQEWYHQLAIRGTIYVPDRRINFDLPDGTPTHRADRDTIVIGLGKEHNNPAWKRGLFRVQALRCGQ